jgi:hypothetical protein
MGTARMDVWVAGGGEPCTIDLRHRWRVRVLRDDGTPYTDLSTDCGHVRVEVPPGRYAVVATRPGAGGPNSRVVRLEHGDHGLVTLFPPPALAGASWWQIATDTLMRLGEVDPDLGRRALAVIGETLRASPAREVGAMW